MRSIVAVKRDGGALSDAQIDAFMKGYVAGEIADYQAAALLTAIFIRGMEARELSSWTRAMLHSGSVLAFPRVDRPKVDKHSTGGVGDKVSIPLAPAAAACGLAVPMISGRGLGHTGGTLDKLESIPGFRTDLSEDEFARCLERTGVALGGQTPRIAPADKKLYALRDVTGLIESIPLIASSILSKKLAEGIDALVLDVKFGSGAFMVAVERGAELARTMLALARAAGVRATAFHTCMSRPLGRAAGHALEIRESIECLGGGGPADLRELVCVQGGEMLVLGGLERDRDAAKRRIARSLDDGSALAVFARAIEAQGGDPRCAEDLDRLPRAPDVDVVRARESGRIAWKDLRELGLAICDLGGGRVKLGDAIDPAVGLVFLRAAGESVERGEPVVEVHHRGGRGLDSARARVERALVVADTVEVEPLVLARIEG